jgi:hypothetical protein
MRRAQPPLGTLRGPEWAAAHIRLAPAVVEEKGAEVRQMPPGQKAEAPAGVVARQPLQWTPGFSDW